MGCWGHVYLWQIPNFLCLIISWNKIRVPACLHRSCVFAICVYVWHPHNICHPYFCIFLFYYVKIHFGFSKGSVSVLLSFGFFLYGATSSQIPTKLMFNIFSSISSSSNQLAYFLIFTSKFFVQLVLTFTHFS